MIYTAFSLNGTWKMAYQEDKYTSERLPEFKGTTIADAVPGYWEDLPEDWVCPTCGLDKDAFEEA